MKNFLFLVKSNEIKSDYTSYEIYPFYLKIMNMRVDFGSQFESMKPFFFDSNGPLDLLRENHWNELRDQIISNFNLYKYAVKTHDKTMKQYVNGQNYAEWCLSAAKVYESNPSGSGMTIKNVKAMIRCGTNIGLNKKFRNMP